ncbi:MAG TPA: hypothetical protein VNZ66_10475 [Aeromicrobium sp.]|nr:hypothetical protein [Aeromicrobium sp.]
MADYEMFTGLPTTVDDGPALRWSQLLVKAVLAALVLGLILTVILWPTVSADVGALTLCITFAVCAGLMVLRQAILAERR